MTTNAFLMLLMLVLLLLLLHFRPDSIMVTKERSKIRGSGGGGEASNESTTKSADSVKLQRERSKANLRPSFKE